MDNKQTTQEDKAPRMFEKADFVLTCHNCGNVDVLQKDVSSGLRIELYPTDTHRLSLGCSKCKSVMTLSFKEVIETGIVDLEGQEIVHRDSDKKEPAEVVEPAETVDEVAPEPEQEVKDEEPVLEENSEKESV